MRVQRLNKQKQKKQNQTHLQFVTIAERHGKAGLPMHTSPLDASSTLPSSAVGMASSRHADNLVYQAVTVAAMMLLLISLWVF